MTNTMKFKKKMLGAYVLIKPDKPVTERKSGIILTEDSVEKSKSGTIVAVGSMVEHPLEVNKRVYWMYPGLEVQFDNENYILLTFDQIIIVDEKRSEEKKNV